MDGVDDFLLKSLWMTILELLILSLEKYLLLTNNLSHLFKTWNDL